MTVKDSFAGYCAELLAPLGTVRVKRMFGGHGIYADDVFVAVVAAETLYLKVDSETEPKFEAAGCRRFSHTTKDQRTLTMAYRAAPPEAMDSPALMRPWAQLAMQAALRARK